MVPLQSNKILAKTSIEENYTVYESFFLPVLLKKRKEQI